ATLFEPEGARDRGTAVLINSATAVRRGYYDAFARFLAHRGFSVVTYDYRGIGGSRPKSLARFRAGLWEWAEKDQAGAIDWVSQHLRPRRLLAIGHSVGGQIVGMADNNNKVDALLAVAAQDGYLGHWPRRAQPMLALRWYVMAPVVSRAFGYLPGWLGIKEDLPGGVAREWARWCRQPGFLFAGAEERRRGFERFDRPLLAYSFADDNYAPRPAVESLLSFYANAERSHRHIALREAGAESIGHFGFFRQRFQDSLWREAADWLEKQAAP
ncbi:MAG TPA: alpha/beta fold hydrolase, partial [Thermoanaerobaculia bacterium]|nr:alpha/beta fold hydrolase [Thermoanaerobaculia bacterium]